MKKHIRDAVLRQHREAMKEMAEENRRLLRRLASVEAQADFDRDRERFARGVMRDQQRAMSTMYTTNLGLRSVVLQLRAERAVAKQQLDDAERILEHNLQIVWAHQRATGDIH